MKGATTVVIQEMVKAIEKRRGELEASLDLREITVTVTMKTGVPTPRVRFPPVTTVTCG